MAKSKYSEETKMAVVLEGFRNGSSIAELCRKHGISDARGSASPRNLKSIRAYLRSHAGSDRKKVP